MEAITAPPEMAQLPLASVWKDTTALGGTRLHDLPQWLEVNNNNSVTICIAVYHKHLDIETVCLLIVQQTSFKLPPDCFFCFLNWQMTAVFPVSATSGTRWTVSCRPLLPAGLRLSSTVSTWNLLQPLQISLPGPFYSALTRTSAAAIQRYSHRFFTYFSHPSLAFQ